MSRPKKRPRLRCSIYTRKSTTEGLDDELTSLDVQRQAAQAYIASQREEGWLCLPTRYDDGGYSGADMERPALQKLLADIEAGKVDAVIVYKVDRLSRSLLDFARLMEVFEKHAVAFVAVTQQFNSSHSMGRLTLHILLSFAQFERELIAERTRDKIAAARRQGRWAGGMPLLGYDLVDSRLVVNPEEADRVRAIFGLYLKTGSLSLTLRELDRRGWRTKRWVTRKGNHRGGRPFGKSALARLLTNVTYLGKVRHKNEAYPGQHEPIVTEELFTQTRQLLARNWPRPSRPRPNHRHEALLEGLVYCSSCAARMGHHYTTKGSRRYRYYVCAEAQRKGRDGCPCPSLPAAELEQFVLRTLASEDRHASLTLRQQRQLVRRTLERIDYNGTSGELTIHRRGGQAPQSFSVQFGATRIHRRALPAMPPPASSGEPVPRVARLLALALRYEELVRESHDYAELAHLGHVSRARLTQIASLALLAPDIQEAILFLPPTPPGTDPLTERHLRPLAAEPDWTRQRQLWARLLASLSQDRP